MPEIRAQPGPQLELLSSLADIRVFGGGAGGGKTFVVLLDPLRFKNNSLVKWVTFRRTSVQLRQPGGPWDTARELYNAIGGIPRESPHLDFRFPRGMTHKFSHLQHEKDMYAWQGAQILGFNMDEATHFVKRQFWYLRSRMRSMSGIPGHCNLTVNPDPDWWGLELISWYIDEEGYPIPDRCGKLRWFIRVNDELVWADSKAELLERYPSDGKFALSVTFIPSKLSDNKILTAKDPQYEATLHSLCYVDRMRLASGNWKIREAAGNIFQRGWFEIVDAVPADCRWIRYWDRAGSDDPIKQKRRKSADPDYTVGFKIGRAPTGMYYVQDINRFRSRPLEVEQNIANTASQDGVNCTIVLEEDPGQAGKSEVAHLIRRLAGYDVRSRPVTTNKVVRAKPASAQSEAGNIKLLRGSWNEPFLREAESFPDGSHDDQVDGLSGGVNFLAEESNLWVG